MAESHFTPVWIPKKVWKGTLQMNMQQSERDIAWEEQDCASVKYILGLGL